MPELEVLHAAGLRESRPEDLRIHRRRCARGFTYLGADGQRISDRGTLRRIRALAVPPSYREVRIATDPDAHLQATGCDDAGRIQYRYHPRWEIVREGRKIDRLQAIAGAIGRIRRRIARDIAMPAGTREKALAAVVMLIDRTYIRIGCESYVHSGRSRGAATLLKRNVSVAGDAVRLAFRGKGGRAVECAVRLPALAHAIAELSALPGRRIFQYRDAAGRIRAVSAADANAYLRSIAGAPVTAKDFRTLAATSEAGIRLAAMEPALEPGRRRQQLAAVMRDVAALLGNTPTVVRKSYVHRSLVKAFADRRLAGLYAGVRSAHERRRGEALVAAVAAMPAGQRSPLR